MIVIDDKMMMLLIFPRIPNKHFKVGIGRVVYDRVRKRKNYFEIPAFLQIERGKSKAGNSNSKSNENKNLFFMFSFDVLNFPALDFPRSI